MSKYLDWLNDISSPCRHKRIRNPFTLEVAPALKTFCIHPLGKVSSFCDKSTCPITILKRERGFTVKSIWED